MHILRNGLLAVLALHPLSAAALNFEFSAAGLPAGLQTSLLGGSTVTFNEANADTAFFRISVNSGVSRITTTQTFSGDFTAITQTNLSSFGPGSRQGIEISFEQGGNPYAVLDSVFYRLVALSPTGGASTVRVRSELNAPSGIAAASETGDTIDSNAFLLINRIGTTIMSSSCFGLGETLNCSPITLAALTSPEMNGPVRIGLFAESSTTGNTSAGFRFLRIDYNDPAPVSGIPEPSTAALAVAGLAAAVWRRTHP